MCRNIKRLRREKPPITQTEIYEASYNLARKVAGCLKPSKRTQPFIDAAALEIAEHVSTLLTNLEIDGKKPCVEISKN